MKQHQNQKILSYRTMIEKDGKYYHGWVPALRGCHTQGDTIEETRKNLREAITGFLLSYQDHNEPIPVDAGIESVETFDAAELFGNDSNVCYA